ncbi:peptidoglycan editing factor PgeF [Beggiatoa leptomitoformis]|uniref:Purine nucleoside phosphorylase n=1 Tax=Beggiatoa leptomitoformis TaxID=288004 RepID=A0A2N9YHK5_9GAMM|nr:peptidoglycan editing factor PgeF [Beggiatoa leptomitoformis]ALG67765.1 peptidoglycan editing factor PgeF [Beggiatoa leptomitoformis]AUI69990.1 peptidoglycan editing factor PgeF [Beggiatoa leptomitoformis]
MLDFIIPQWTAPARVKAYCTTRQGGYSSMPYHGFNLGDHVGDAPVQVLKNRALLCNSLQLPREPLWLKQVHGTVVATLEHPPVDGIADAATTKTVGYVCAILTADCLPVLFCDKAGTQVAAAHAGWRGLLNGVLENTVQQLALPSEQVLVWLGACISQQAFEVGDEVYQAFVTQHPESAIAFRASRAQHWWADLYELARQRLRRMGITVIYGGDYCTFTEKERFFSYRREPVTGRMASLIWME